MKQNTIIIGLITIATLGLGYILIKKNKPKTNVLLDNKTEDKPSIIDREKIAHDYAQSMSEIIKSEDILFRGTPKIISLNGLQQVNSNQPTYMPNASSATLAQNFLPKKSVLSIYEETLELLNQITDDNDVLLYMKYLQEKFNSLDGQIFIKNFRKKYPSIKID